MRSRGYVLTETPADTFGDRIFSSAAYNIILPLKIVNSGKRWNRWSLFPLQIEAVVGLLYALSTKTRAFNGLGKLYRSRQKSGRSYTATTLNLETTSISSIKALSLRGGAHTRISADQTYTVIRTVFVLASISIERQPWL